MERLSEIVERSDELVYGDGYKDGYERGYQTGAVDMMYFIMGGKRDGKPVENPITVRP